MREARWLTAAAERDGSIVQVRTDADRVRIIRGERVTYDETISAGYARELRGQAERFEVGGRQALDAAHLRDLREEREAAKLARRRAKLGLGPVLPKK